MTYVPSSSSAGAAASGGLSTFQKIALPSPGVIDFTSIPATAEGLILVAIVRGTNAALQDNPKVLINNDSGANYDVQQVNAVATTVSSTESFGASAISTGQIAAASAAAGLFTVVTVEIPGYASTTWNKVIHLTIDTKLTALTTGMQTLQASAFWRSTVAVNRITLSGNTTANLVTGSTGYLYLRGTA